MSRGQKSADVKHISHGYPLRAISGNWPTVAKLSGKTASFDVLAHFVAQGVCRCRSQAAEEFDCAGEFCTRTHEERWTQRTKGPYFPILPAKAAPCRSFPGFSGVPLHRCKFCRDPLCNHCGSLHVIAFHCISFHFIASLQSLHATIATMQRKALCAGLPTPHPKRCKTVWALSQ